MRQHSHSPRRRALFQVMLIWLALGLSLLVTMPGCGGCTKPPVKTAEELEAEAKQKAEEEKNRRKPDFEANRMSTLPNALTALESAVKPGHWSSATVEMVANHYDFQGTLRTEPFDLEGLPYRLGASRSVNLSKGQKKFLEMTFYVPPGKKGAKVGIRLDSKDGARDLLAAEFPASRMKAHQFYFFVFAEDPDRYAFLKEPTLDSVNPADGGFDNPDAQNAYYRVMIPPVKKRTPLASNPLVWTTLAYMLWDGKDPSLLTAEQQSCLIDWLHWGGQLIVSGPGTFEKLKGSFLEKYLPATGGEKLDIQSADLAPLNALFTQGRLPLSPVSAWTGQKLLIDPDAPDVNVVVESPTGEPLVVERRVGRGNIVVTAFRLAQRELVQWVGYDAFLNSCLLRRGPRQFSISDSASLEVNWLDAPFEGPAPDWARERTISSAVRLDPQRVSDVRYFSRDAGFPRNNKDWHRYTVGTPLGRFNPETADLPMADRAGVVARMRDFMANLSGDEEEAAISGGVAAWSHFNPTAEMSRDALRKAAGIRIPEPRFVLWTLAAYLIVLVPLNWAVFRVMGRVEWAWIAAPVITVIFSAIVVRLAHLDVGFARARTEVGIVELHQGHLRAHVTRYTALYTSLGTSYDFRFDDPSALVQPFPPFSRDTAEESKLLRGQSRTTVNYRRHLRGAEDGGGGTSITLEGYTVSSNSLGMVHSEHMHSLSGPIKLSGSAATGLKVDNDTELSLKAALVVRRAVVAQKDENDEPVPDALEVAWIGSLPAGERAELKFEPLARTDLWATLDDSTRGAAIEKISSLLRLGCEKLEPEELRLVGWTDEELTGMAIEPAASQTRLAHLVVAHLKYGVRPAPQADKSSRTEQEAKINKGEIPAEVKF